MTPDEYWRDNWQNFQKDPQAAAAFRALSPDALISTAAGAELIADVEFRVGIYNNGITQLKLAALARELAECRKELMNVTN